MGIFTFWKNPFGRRVKKDELLPEKQRLMEELRTALQEWKQAQVQFEYAHGRDEIDYAIFAVEAAQKRYEMLLRKAKLQCLHVLRTGYPKVAKG